MCSLIRILLARGVLQRVGDGLLRDAQQVLLHLLRQLGAASPDTSTSTSTPDPAVHMRVPDSSAAARSCPSSTEARRSITERRASVRLCRAMRRARSRYVRAGDALVRHAHGHRVELRGDADEALRQGVVDLARQARALFQHQREAVADLPQPQLVHRPRGSRQQQRTHKHRNQAVS